MTCRGVFAAFHHYCSWPFFPVPAGIIFRLGVCVRGVEVSDVILFGSYAKGMAKQDSDIDLAVVSSQFGKDNWKEMIFLRKLALEIDSHIEPLPFSPQDMEDRYSTLSEEIRKYGVSLYS